MNAMPAYVNPYRVCLMNFVGINYSISSDSMDISNQKTLKSIENLSWSLSTSSSNILTIRFIEHTQKRTTPNPSFSSFSSRKSWQCGNCEKYTSRLTYFYLALIL